MARTIGGGRKASLFSTIINAIRKGVRMITFLIIPAFAWENLGIFQSYKRGFSILRQRLPEFISGYTLSYLTSIIIFLPPAAMFYFSDEVGANFPDWCWVVCIIYLAFAWSYTIFLEQMFVAELYLWQLKWEKEIQTAKELGNNPPEFHVVVRPSILDDNPDFIET